MSIVVAYRHAAYDSPWWVIPSTREGRFNRAYEDLPTQYLALHPLGPMAELLRHELRGPEPDRADMVLANLWALLVEAEGLVQITFDNCNSDYGITPEELVGDDYMPTQALADRLRASIPGLTVPSAALPGTDNLILFGPRVMHPYLEMPVIPAETPTGHLSDGARPPREVLSLVRWKGIAHVVLERWLATGTYEKLDDPMPLRW